MGGLWDRVHGRSGINAAIAGHPNAAHATGIDEDYKDKDFAGDIETSGSDSDTLSLEQRDEKEVQQHPNEVTESAQTGVKKAEAAALVWSKKAIWGVYAWIWLCYFMLAFQQGVQTYVTAYAYSAFSSAPQINTAVILGQIIGGVIKLPIAKLLNIWGRAEGYYLFVVVYLVGMIILAASNGPNTYAAGYVIYWIGYDAIYLILDIFIADSFGLRNRALVFAFSSTPFIITAFTASLAGQSFVTNQLTGAGWRWGIGTFIITNFVVFTPLAIIFKLYTLKAKKMGLYKSEPSGRSVLQSIGHYFVEFDIIGCFLLMASFVLFLLPFSLQSYGRAPYDSATFIAMVVIGFCLFFVFAAWERWGARVTFIRWELLQNRTIAGSCLLAATLYFCFYCWDLNYYYFCLVNYALPVSLAGYMNQIYNVGSTFWSVVFGLWIRYTYRFKWFALIFGMGLMLLGNGLRIWVTGNYGGPEYAGPIGYLIMCQIFIAFAGGTLIISSEMAVMSASDREGVPLMLSLLYLFNALGGAIGQAVSTAIYSNEWEKSARQILPQSRWSVVPELYVGGYATQIKFPPGTVERTASNFAWSQTQYYSSIAGTAILVLGIVAILLWKDYKVDRKQNKGTIL